MQCLDLASLLLTTRAMPALQIALWPCFIAVLAVGCVHTIRLEPIPPRDAHGRGSAPLLVLGAVAGGEDPLPLSGTDLAFEGVIHALERYVALAADDWATRHGPDRPGGWELTIELVRSSARTSNAQLTAELDARFTLRGTAGRVYVAQTSQHCKHTDVFSTGDQAASVVRSCMEHMARDLAGWLEGVSP